MSPLTLGPFTVDRDGILQPREAGLRPSLRFAWRGRSCEAELAGSALHLASLAARVPSSAEPGADRATAFATLASLPRHLPAGWRLRLLPDHRVRLEQDAILDSPPTATRLLATMVRFAMALDPYLDQLEQSGIACPAGISAAPVPAR
jgi:hypothetical protein